MPEKQAVQILLVEDDPSDIQLTLHALRHDNLANAIRVVRDGAEALDFLFCRGSYSQRDPSHTPKLILLDLKLPKMDGLEVLRTMKEDERTKAIPVVILTSSRQESDMVDCYKLGVNSYISKPVDFSVFRQTVTDLGYYWLVVNLPPPDTAFQTEEGEIAVWPESGTQ